MLRAHVKATLARWVLRKRAEHHRGDAASGVTSVAARDEATHFGLWEGRRRFGEDYTFAAAQVGLGIVVRLEWLPGRQSHRVWVTLLRPDYACVLEGGQRIVRGSERDPWRAAGLELDCIEPLRQWDIRFVGRLLRQHGDGRDPAARSKTQEGADRIVAVIRASLDLTFVRDAPPFSPGVDDDPELLARRFGAATWDAKLLRAVRRDQNRGYVQTGRLEGTMVVGDELIPVRAPCVRLHSWGVRDWGGPDEAFQCFAAWPEPDGGRGRRLWIHRETFPFLTLEGGFVQRTDTDRNEPVTSLGATLERRPQRAPAHASLQVTHDGVAASLHLQMLRDTSFVVDGRGEVHLGLFATSDGGHGIWGSQRRVLPRVG